MIKENGWESIWVAETVAGFEVLEFSWRKMEKKDWPTSH
jgi:hypothetical protein